MRDSAVPIGGRSPLPASYWPWTEEGHLRVLGASLHFIRSRQVEVVVLLSKMSGWVADCRNIVPFLAERYRVIPPERSSRAETPTLLIYGKQGSIRQFRSARPRRA
jgi:hypothetical protein